MKDAESAGLHPRIAKKVLYGGYGEDEHMLTTDVSASEEKALRLIGLAKRAGKLACGREATLISMKKKRAYVVIVARDASERTILDMEKQAAHYGLQLVGLGDRSELGLYTGTDIRACVAVEDEGFARGILSNVKS